MPLNRSSGNMYPDEIVTHTWNPFKGQCSNILYGFGCTYCMMKYGNRRDLPQYYGPISFYPKELRVRFPIGSKTFVCSAVDMWHPKVEDHHIAEVLSHCRTQCAQTPESLGKPSFLFQSKGPDRFWKFIGEYPTLSTFGTTVETDDVEFYNGISRAPDPVTRLKMLRELCGPDFPYPIFVTVEPIIKFTEDFLRKLLELNLTHIVIGADSCGSLTMDQQPDIIEVWNLVCDLSANNVKVYVKQNITGVPGSPADKAMAIDTFKSAGLLHVRKKKTKEPVERVRQLDLL